MRWLTQLIFVTLLALTFGCGRAATVVHGGDGRWVAKSVKLNTRHARLKVLLYECESRKCSEHAVLAISARGKKTVEIAQLKAGRHTLNLAEIVPESYVLGLDPGNRVRLEIGGKRVRVPAAPIANAMAERAWDSETANDCHPELIPRSCRKLAAFAKRYRGTERGRQAGDLVRASERLALEMQTERVASERRAAARKEAKEHKAAAEKLIAKLDISPRSEEELEAAFRSLVIEKSQDPSFIAEVLAVSVCSAQGRGG